MEPMENYRRLLDAENMTPDEQTERIIELLAIACVRIAQQQKQGSQNENLSPLDSSANPLYPSVPKGQAEP